MYLFSISVKYHPTVIYVRLRDVIRKLSQGNHFFRIPPKIHTPTAPVRYTPYVSVLIYQFASCSPNFKPPKVLQRVLIYLYTHYRGSFRSFLAPIRKRIKSGNRTFNFYINRTVRLILYISGKVKFLRFLQSGPSVKHALHMPRYGNIVMCTFHTSKIIFWCVLQSKAYLKQLLNNLRFYRTLSISYFRGSP